MSRSAHCRGNALQVFIQEAIHDRLHLRFGMMLAVCDRQSADDHHDTEDNVAQKFSPCRRDTWWIPSGVLSQFKSLWFGLYWPNPRRALQQAAGVSHSNLHGVGDPKSAYSILEVAVSPVTDRLLSLFREEAQHLANA